MKVMDIRRDSFKDEVEEFKGTVLIDFFAPWCSPCKTMARVIESVAEVADENVKVCKVNVDEESELANRFGIMTIPTLVVMKNGEIVNRSIGVTGKRTVFDMLN
ncbi:MAG: thioredoxin [Clostridia bacterium]|nr:thioredoxin [Clostridia bacterium]